MASDKAQPDDRAHEATSEDSHARPSAAASMETARVAEDLDRIANYLRDNRSATFERASGLAAEIAQRRQEIAGRLASGSAFAERLGDIARELPDRRLTGVGERRALKANPVLAERLHAFCRDMDALLDSFRARISHARRIKH